MQTYVHHRNPTQGPSIQGLSLIELKWGPVNLLPNQRVRSQNLMSATILLIDDNAVQAATRQTILKRAGYHVIAVLSPERALEQLRANEYPEHIALIITDHVMPGMNGAEFVRQLRQFAPTVPVLVISGMAEAEEEYESLDVHFRLKPLLPDNLLASVYKLVESNATL